MKKKTTTAIGLWWLFFAPPLFAQDLGPHFLKIKDGIYIYGRDDIAGRDPTSNCGIIITQEGRPVARITPLATVNNEALIGSMKGQISINGEIFSTGLEWDAQS